MAETGDTRIPYFTRAFVTSGESFSRIGDGAIGGKAQGLVVAKNTLESGIDPNAFPGVLIGIPISVVLTSEVFDALIERNHIDVKALSDESDERIGHMFQAADLPAEYVGDLRALIEQVHSPLALRSSSLLEDAMFRPFAGVYQTKMIPNNQPDPDQRFHKLVEAIKFVYASTFAGSARRYIAATNKKIHDEKMAIVIQEVVGARHDDRFYPDVSGVARSYNFYPAAGVRPAEGVVNLALGLGKTIVDGGVSWTYSPAHPKAPAPFASSTDLARNTQARFWAVNMGEPPAYDPMAETEYLCEADLPAAEFDGTLRYTASTFDAVNDRIVPGTSRAGARVLDFAPLLKSEEYPLNDLLKAVLASCEGSLGTEVEIEFAVTFSARDRIARFAFLQLRPMVVQDDIVTITDEEMASPQLLLASNRVMGNGVIETIRDVVYVKPNEFDASRTRAIASELEGINAKLLAEDRPYLVIGFGRWGSSDPWLGLPVEWGQISGARAIVEATLPDMNIEPSQGSHFFHNLSSFQVSYFTVHHGDSRPIDWDWLAGQQVVRETQYVCHVQARDALVIKVDGRSGRGGIWYR